jgi:hypothetical protein
MKSAFTCPEGRRFGNCPWQLLHCSDVPTTRIVETQNEPLQPVSLCVPNENSRDPLFQFIEGRRLVEFCVFHKVAKNSKKYADELFVKT